MDVSLYIHIPFCTEKCDYCDFYSRPLEDLTLRERNFFTGAYLDTLLAETERRLDELRRFAARGDGGCGISIPTVYIGGGTPSVLGPQGITRLLKGIREICGSSPGGPFVEEPSRKEGIPGEVTVEANPETADLPFLEACASGGVTRLSLGIQSFEEAPRRAIGRRGEAALFLRQLSRAAEIFGPGLSVDLMSGLPGQSGDSLLRDIDRALFFGPGHISLYDLAVEEGTPLYRRHSEGTQTQDTAPLPSADDAALIWLAGRDALLGAGYDHYEVSNFAKKTGAASFGFVGKTTGRFRCLHNIRYWRMENWIGVGPAASGTIVNNDGRALRTSYAPDTELFLKNPLHTLGYEDVEKDTVLRESILMGFRYSGGPDPALFLRRFRKTVEASIPRTLLKWKPFLQPGKNALTEEGLLFLNRFVVDAFGELDGEESVV